MLFNDPRFLLLFFPIVTITYFILPKKFQWLILLVASLFFYASSIPIYLFLLIGSVAVNYFFGMGIDRLKSHRKAVFILAISSNLVVLGFFKYFNFFLAQIQSLLDFIGIQQSLPILSVALPVGISFYTFQVISYIVEVYLRRQKPEVHIGKFALYMFFYPQLVAGPIERPQHLLPQLHRAHRFNYIRITAGLRRMLWGLFKKAVIADRLGFFVDHVFNNPFDFGGISTFIAMNLFTYQLYADFSGYTDMALGIATILGFNLKENFNQPFRSKTIGEFWRRWHISLSTWFRDYLYIPFGTNKQIRPPWYVGILVVFFVIGLWHGAGWTFAIFGLLHGTYIVVTRIVQKYLRRHKLLQFKQTRTISSIQIILTFHLASFSFLFFRANSLSSALHMTKQLLFVPFEILSGISVSTVTLDQPIFAFVFAIALIVLMEVVEEIQVRGFSLRKYSLAVRWSLYYFLVFMILFFGKIFQKQLFIYFQF